MVNGVFLLALCFTIFLEAIQRLFGSPEVGQPKLVVVVGSLGLLSNIVGLFLFHEHGHSHGGEGHSHGHSHGGESAAEEGHSHAISHKKLSNGNHSHKDDHVHESMDGQVDEQSPLLSSSSNGSRPMAVGGTETPLTDEDNDTLDDLLVHPARTREAIVRQAYDAGFGSSPRNSGDTGVGHRRTLSGHSQSKKPKKESLTTQAGTGVSASKQYSSEEHEHPTGGHVHSHDHAEGDGHTHEHDHGEDGHAHDHSGEDGDADHEKEYEGGGGGHSHGNMNMRGVFLHVMGDAVSMKALQCYPHWNTDGIEVAWECWGHRSWPHHLAHKVPLPLLLGSDHLAHHHGHHLFERLAASPISELYSPARDTFSCPT